MTDEQMLERVRKQLVEENDDPALNILDTLIDLFVNDPNGYNALLDNVANVALDIRRDHPVVH